MSALGNIIWFLFGGFIMAILYFLAGILLCITIIGIPFGLQLFKIARFVMLPFGYQMQNVGGSMGCLAIVFNLIWIFLGWWELAIMHCIIGLIFCITIIGIPFGYQHFKIALGTVFPFGQEIVPID